MERRDFLKYLFSASVCFSCACSKNSYTQKDDKNDKKWPTGHIAIPVCYHCNLNCAYCNHFSPIAPKYEMPVEVFERDLAQLKKISNDSVTKITLLGGEPLLHKNIEKLMFITNKYFPTVKKRLLTNGILLKEKKQDFFKSCIENDFYIECSQYRLSDNYPKDSEISDIKAKYNIKIITYDFDAKNKFIKMNLNKNYSKNDVYRFKKCILNIGCAQLDNGILYPCCVISGIKFFNNYFKNYAFKLTKDDYLDIHKVKTHSEVVDFLLKDRVFCRYCHYGKQLSAWRLSKKELSEWYDLKKDP